MDIDLIECDIPAAKMTGILCKGRKEDLVSEKQKRPDTREEKPASAPDTKQSDDKKEEEDDLLNFDDLRNTRERVLKKWKQVGQTGGE